MSKITNFFKKRKERDQQLRQDILLNKESAFYELEAYRTLRTNLNFSLVKKDGCKKVIITSSVSKEGKSTVAVNLARIMAQTNSKILIIDCDLRKPRLHKFYKTKCIPGLSNYLIGENTLEEIINTTDNENLSIIYSGTIPPNPAEMIGSEGMQQTLAELENKFDFILLDCPPILPVADSLIVSQFADGVILVSKQGYTTHQALKESIAKLEFSKAKILGLVLNGTLYNNDKKYSRYSKMYS